MKLARKYTLEEYAKKVGLPVAAERIGCTDDAIHKAIKSGRNIRVTVEGTGEVSAEEVKVFPSWSKAAIARNAVVAE